MEVIVDYLQFNIGNQDNIDNVINDYLFLGDREFIDIKGQLGYKLCKCYNNIRVMYDGTEDMGTLIQISGTGCRKMETIIGFSWYDYIIFLVEKEAKFSRIDIAIDCFDKELDIKKMNDEIVKGNVRTYCKTYDRRNELKIKDNTILTDTLYIGKRSSDTYFRVYDKKLERECKGFEVKQDSWIRFEVVLKHFNSNKFIEFYSCSGDLDYLVNGVINNYLAFLDKDNNKNISRKNKAKWWENFMHDLQKIKIAKGKEENSIEKMEKWVITQCAATIKVLKEVKGQNFVNEIITNAKLDNEKTRIIFQEKTRKNKVS